VIQTDDHVLFVKGKADRLPFADDTFALSCFSPPYLGQRLYLEDGVDLGVTLDCDEWVSWMMRVIREAVRVTRGLVVCVCAGPTEERNYQPGPEGLIWEWHRSGGLQECPVYWKRNGIPGSGGDQWLRKDVEYCIAFKKTPKLPFSDNTACGEPPKFAPGGKMSNRMINGERVNVKAASRRNRKGVRCKETYVPPKLANPGTLLDTGATGGGLLGWDGAHENEAPYPEEVPEFFIKSFTRPGDLVLDCFSGSGTTASVANRLGRRGIGVDLRQSQCRLGRRRIENPHSYLPKGGGVDKPLPLFDRSEAS
jgi:hypothetical protein